MRVISESPSVNYPTAETEGLTDKIVSMVRVFYLTAILVFVLLLQTSQDTFINVSMLLPIYSVLSLAFLLNSLFLIFKSKIQKIIWAEGFLFALDAIFITAINVFSHGNYTIFLVLYLLNIFLCALKYRTEGAVYLAMWTSLLFSGLLIYGPQLEGQSLYLGLVLNNFSFFAVALLSGFLSERMLTLNWQVIQKTKSIKDLQKLNELILSNISSGLIALDANYRVSHSNGAAGDILKQELDDKNLKEVFFNHFEILRTHLDSAFNGQLQRLDLKVGDKQSGEKLLEIVISPMVDPETHEKGLVMMLTDVTELRKLERELKQKEKLAAVGQLAAGIAHEIRNPLASISGSIQLMLSDDKGVSDENQRLMRITVKEIDRLNSLISEFLDYVRPEQLGDDMININLVLKEILESLAVNKNLNHRVQQDMQLNSQALIAGNPDKLKQAFLNIMINAYQAMAESSSGWIKVRSWDESGRVCVSIADNGSGISTENIERIFEPFHTTKSGGTGLGLAITHKILEAHGASIDVDSTLGGGTVFTIQFLSGNNPLGNEMKLKREA